MIHRWNCSHVWRAPGATPPRAGLPRLGKHEPWIAPPSPGGSGDSRRRGSWDACPGRGVPFTKCRRDGADGRRSRQSLLRRDTNHGWLRPRDHQRRGVASRPHPREGGCQRRKGRRTPDVAIGLVRLRRELWRNCWRCGVYAVGKSCRFSAKNPGLLVKPDPARRQMDVERPAAPDSEVRDSGNHHRTPTPDLRAPVRTVSVVRPE